MNEAVGESNQFQKLGRKTRLVLFFSKMEFCKCIGCILSVVTHWKKGHKLWGETHRSDTGKVPISIDRDVFVKIDLLKVRCCLYHFHYCYLTH